MHQQGSTVPNGKNPWKLNSRALANEGIVTEGQSRSYITKPDH